jgi:hypothetical protein
VDAGTEEVQRRKKYLVCSKGKHFWVHSVYAMEERVSEGGTTKEGGGSGGGGGG